MCSSSLCSFLPSFVLPIITLAQFSPKLKRGLFNFKILSYILSKEFFDPGRKRHVDIKLRQETKLNK